MPKPNIKDLLKPFAERRLAELDEERAVILNAFPSLRGVSPKRAEAPLKLKPKQKHRKLSAKARKALSDSMKKRWAEAKKAGRKAL